MLFRLPEGLLLGVASAATQIEGGETGHNWNDWYHKGHIKDGSNPASSDHWSHWQEDVALMASMGIQVYRFGVEWSRLLPAPGQPDEAAIAQYRRELSALKEAGIQPLLTIHHFSNPMWFEEKGGFSRWENTLDYLRLVHLVVSRFGDLVSDYITINEPNVYATNGYLFGQWPPGRTSYTETFRVMENLALCHILAYRLIHRLRKKMGYTDTRVSFANHVRAFRPKCSKNPWHIFCAKAADWLFQGAITRAMMLGEFCFPLKQPSGISEGNYADFIAVNYYTRSSVAGFADGVRENSPRNDLGWEIYPEGMVRCANRLYKMLPRPIWVTENGTCDNTDCFRARYLYDHLQALSRSKLPFERYYHWCFCDNFEWLEGFGAKFGLVQVDLDSHRRTIKNSGRFYSELIANHGVTQDMYDRYVKDEVYTIR